MVNTVADAADRVRTVESRAVRVLADTDLRALLDGWGKTA